MRLIDADRLLNPGYTDMFDNPIRITVFSREAIEYAPTVEAIPIEWIEEYPEKVSEFDVKALINIYSVIYEMLEYWEAENETN